MVTIQREVRKRSFMGKLIKWVFIAFNLLMLVWMLYSCGVTGTLMNEQASEAGKAGAAVGATIAVGMLLAVWAMGDIILGLFVLLTRGQKILITEESDS